MGLLLSKLFYDGTAGANEGKIKSQFLDGAGGGSVGGTLAGATLSDIGSNGGSGYIPRYTGTGVTIGNSSLFDTGTNIGIGTTTPGYKLDVVGTINASALRLPNGSGSGRILTSDASGNATWSVESDPQVGANTLNYLPKWDGSALIAGLISDTGTNIGIGTATPSYKLDVVGTINASNLRLPNLIPALPTTTTLGTTGSSPEGITIDTAGNVYTVNYNSRNITKITPAGVSTAFGSTGSDPGDIALDVAGNVYVPNFFLNQVTKITPAGVSSVFGTTGTNPNKITIDYLGNIYTTNNSSNNVTKITPAGVSTVLGTTGIGP